jgi:two-component system cell cycle sensor histidine kinase/response regulator CckA
VPAPYSTVRFHTFAGEVIISVPLAMGMTDAGGNLVLANEAFCATVGRDDLVGTGVEAIVVADYHHTIRAAHDRALADQTTVEISAAVPFRPEEKLLIRIQPLPQGVGFATLISMRDVREQMRVEAQVAAATRMQAVGQLAGGIAHDFNNILTAVLMLNDQLLVRHPPGDEDHDELAEIRRNGQRAAALVEQLLAFARQQPQRQRLLDVGELVEGLRPLLTQLIGPGIALSVVADCGASVILADPGQIEQVIVNLAVNARDAMAGHGTLTIALSSIAGADVMAEGHRIIPAIDHIRILVVDSGTGIPPAIASKIFEPFFTTKPLGQGTGLGLSTVYGIVKQSNGYVFAAPAPTGQGTAFCIYLPAIPRPAEQAAPLPPIPAPSDHGRLAGLSVLLVEDDAAIRLTFSRALKQFGMTVVTAESADPALEILGSELHLDILISDVMMPGLDGVALAARATEIRATLPIVLMSGYSELPLHRAADASGMRFIAKPFSLVELLDVIAETVPGRV